MSDPERSVEIAAPFNTVAAPETGEDAELPIEERKRFVWEMVVLRKKLTETAAAKVLGLHRNSVVNLVRQLRLEARDRAAEADGFGELGVLLERFAAVGQAAWCAADEAKSPAAKAMLYGQAIHAWEVEAKLRLQTGLFPRAEKRISGKIEILGGVDPRRMTTEELKQTRRALVNRILRQEESEKPDSSPPSRVETASR